MAMLKELIIQNFGLIDKINLEFDEGLTIFTGETGAGKSILLDALRCVLGERMDTSFIRDPQKPCIIEAVFEIISPALKKVELIQEFIDPSENTLIIQRSLSNDGKSKVKINGLTVTIAQLKAIGNHLVDFHGAHDHQMLLSQDRHLGMLDQLVSFGKTQETYSELYLQYKKLEHQLNALVSLSQTRERDVDILAHEVKELESVPLNEDHYQDICQQQIKINNAQRLHEHIQNALSVFEDEDLGVETQLRRSFNPLKNLAQIDPAMESSLQSLAQIQEQTQGLIAQLTDYADGLDFDAAQAEEINRQHDTYSDILRKYGPQLTDAQQYYQQAKAKLDSIRNFSDNNAQLNAQIKEIESSLTKVAKEMTTKRQKAASLLNKTVESELKDLGIAHVRFEVRFDRCEFNAFGQDDVAFYISPNAGEDLKPLADIVSSGEAARVMLALKKALINVDPVPVLIFDEIDAQIGGRLGDITGKKLKELAAARQVVLITHLPQIASFADKHFKVIKIVKAQRAITEVKELDKKERIEEIAQMMSGQKTSNISLTHAKDMLAAAQKS